MKHLRHVVGGTIAMPFILLVLALMLVSEAIKLVRNAVYYIALGTVYITKAIINFFE